MSCGYAVVVVLHRSRERARAAAADARRAAARRRRRRPRRRRRAARARARRDGHRAPRQPRLRRGQQPRARARHAAGHGPAEPGHDRSARARASSPRRAHSARPARARGCSTQDGSVQRSAHPLPGTLGAFLPAVLPGRAHRAAEPYRAGNAPHRRLGGRRLPGGARPTRCDLGPSTSASTCSPRTWTCACRARAHGHPHDPAPGPRRSRHTGRHSVEAEPFELLARQRPRRDRAQAGHAARSGSTTPPRCSRSPRGRSRQAAASESSERAQLERAPGLLGLAWR